MLRMGGVYGELFVGPLLDSWLTGGLSAPSFGTVSECGPGLHLGTWSFGGASDIGDNVYVNYSTLRPDLDLAVNGYVLWGR